MTINRELMRGTGPVAILKILEGGEMYGYELAVALTSRSHGHLEMGQSTLYPMLYNLESKKLIRARWDDSAPRARKYYSLTPRGRRYLAEQAAQWTRAVEAMRALGVVSGREAWA